MAELTGAMIKSYASDKWKAYEDDSKNIAHAFNLAGLHDSFTESVRIEQGEVVLPEALADISTERRRKEIISELDAQIDRINHFPDAFRKAANSPSITSLSFFESLGAVCVAVITTAVATPFLKKVSLNYGISTPAFLWWVLGIIIFFVALAVRKWDLLKYRTQLAPNIANHLAQIASAHTARLRQIKSELEDRHNIDLIRARELAGIHQQSAVDTAVRVGAVTTSVAEKTAEITRNLIKDGKQLQADNVAQQVKTIDQLAGRLEQQASRPVPAAPSTTDDRDARIAALQQEIAKTEEIKALEAKLAALKGGA